jgi:hypothetical protein
MPLSTRSAVQRLIIAVDGLFAVAAFESPYCEMAMRDTLKMIHE